MCVSHFTSVFAVVFAISRLSAHASFDLQFVFELCAGVWGGYDVHATATFVFSFSFGDLLLLGCFPVCVCVCVSHFASVFAVVFAISRLSAHASFDLQFVFELCAGVWGGYDVHATATCVFFFFW